MLRTLQTALRPIAAAALVASAIVFAPFADVRADELDDRIDAMEDAEKDDDEGATLKLMVELQENLDPKVTKALVKLTRSRSDKIAAAAVRAVATRKDEKFGKSLKRSLDDKKLYKDRVDVYYAYLDAAGMYADPKLREPLEKVVKKFLPTDADISRRAIAAFGTIREKEVVDQLLDWLQITENTRVSGMSDITRDNYGKAKSQILETLTDLTGQDIGDSKTWLEFWEKRRKKFEFPDPNAPEVDPATLTEWTDIAYGYTVKKPEAAEWKFKEARDDFERMRLLYETVDDSGDTFAEAQLSFQIHNTTKGSVGNMKQLTDWYVEQYETVRMSEMRSPPEVEERKIAGRDFVVVTAKGQTKDVYAAWGAAEMRVYLTQVDHIIVRFEATFRLGGEPEIAEALWGAVENSTWDD